MDFKSRTLRGKFLKYLKILVNLYRSSGIIWRKMKTKLAYFIRFFGLKVKDFKDRKILKNTF